MPPRVGTSSWTGGCFCQRSGVWDRARRARAKVPSVGDLPDQARAGAGDVGACLEAGGADALGDRRFSVYGDCAPPAGGDPSTRLLVCPGAVTSLVRCWLEPPPLELPQEETGGRPRRAVRLAPDAPKARTVAEVIARLPARAVEAAECGHRHEGATDLRLGARARDRKPGWLSWSGGMAARAPLGERSDGADVLLRAGAQTGLAPALAQVAGTRYTVEQVIKEAKSEVGFDRYEVRYLAQLVSPHHPLHAGPGLAGRPAAGGGRKKRAWRISPCPKCGACWKWPCPCLSGASASAWPGPIGGGASAIGRGLCHYRHRYWPKYAGPNPLDSS